MNGPVVGPGRKWVNWRLLLYPIIKALIGNQCRALSAGGEMGCLFVLKKTTKNLCMNCGLIWLDTKGTQSNMPASLWVNSIKKFHV